MRRPVRRAARGRRAGADEADRAVPRAVGLARRTRRRVPRHRRHVDVSAERQGRRRADRRRRPPLDLRCARPHVHPDGGRATTGVARRRHAAGDRRGSWRDAPLPPRRRRIVTSGTAHQRPAHDPLVRRRGRPHRDGSGDGRAPGRDRHAGRSGHLGDAQLPRLGALQRADHRRHRRDRRLDHAAGGLRIPTQVPGAAQRARRAVHAVRRDVLRRGPSCRPPPGSSW